QVASRRVVPVLDDRVNRLVPGMAVEIAADELAVVGPFIEGIGGAVAPGETFAAANPLQQIRLLGLREWQLARGVEEDSIVLREVFHGDFLARVLRAGRLKRSALVAQ